MTLRPRSLALGLGIGMAVAVLVTLTRSGNPVDAWCYYGFDTTNPRNPTAASSSPPVARMDAVRGGAVRGPPSWATAEMSC
jgi:hypothetical protein